MESTIWDSSKKIHHMAKEHFIPSKELSKGYGIKES